jgi:hypothetical protein
MGVSPVRVSRDGLTYSDAGRFLVPMRGKNGVEAPVESLVAPSGGAPAAASLAPPYPPVGRPAGESKLS